MSDVLAQWRALFDTLGTEEVPLTAVFHPEVEFTDPIRTVSGLDGLRAHFDGMTGNLEHCSFAFAAPIGRGPSVAIPWRMTLTLRRGPRTPIEVDGISVLDLEDDRVRRQRDYFDLGQLVYEHVPLLGLVIGLIRRRL